jgi:hypothetical protein
MDNVRKPEEYASVGDYVLRVLAMAAAMRVVCLENQLRLRQQSLSISHPRQPATEIQFTGQVPFGFAFTEGHEATFRVPSGHRFVIEHITISCWTRNGTMQVRMITRSRHMFRRLTLDSGTREQPGRTFEFGAGASILVHGSTANTLSFNNSTDYSSSTVPPETYVQMWGYLEPTENEVSS